MIDIENIICNCKCIDSTDWKESLKSLEFRLMDLRVKNYKGLSKEDMDNELYDIQLDIFKLMDKL